MPPNPDIYLGATLKMNVEPWHYCVFISDPQPPENKILMVRITGLTEKWEDHCVLGEADYPALTKLSVPAYRDAWAAPAEGFQALLDGGKMRVAQPISSECLDKILEGARASDELPPKFKIMLP